MKSSKSFESKENKCSWCGVSIDPEERFCGEECEKTYEVDAYEGRGRPLMDWDY